MRTSTDKVLPNLLWRLGRSWVLVPLGIESRSLSGNQYYTTVSLKKLSSGLSRNPPAVCRAKPKHLACHACRKARQQLSHFWIILFFFQLPCLHASSMGQLVLAVWKCPAYLLLHGSPSCSGSATPSLGSPRSEAPRCRLMGTLTHIIWNRALDRRGTLCLVHLLGLD